MTREQQQEVKRIIKDRGGTINEDGWISKDTSIYTHTIDALREQDAQVFYQGSRHQLWMNDWNEDLMKPEESEWKQKIREIIIRTGNTINDRGYVHGTLWTDDVRRILAAGGNLMILDDGKVCITNWEDC